MRPLLSSRPLCVTANLLAKSPLMLTQLHKEDAQRLKAGVASLFRRRGLQRSGGAVVTEDVEAEGIATQAAKAFAGFNS